MISSSAAGRAAIVVVACAALVSPVGAQNEWRGVQVAVLGGPAFGLPPAFAQCSNHRSPAVGGRVGVRTLSFLALDGTVSMYTGAREEGCGIGAPPPSPGATGTFVSERYDAGVIGYPVYHVGARLAVSPIRKRGEEVQVAVGLERTRGMWIPVVGVTDLMGRGPVRFLIDVEFAWYSVERIRTTTELVNGVVVNTRETRVPEKTKVTRLRLGLLLRHR